MRGFKRYCPEGLDDWHTDEPWGMPWTWTDTEDYAIPDLTAYECGEKWAELHFEENSRELEEEDGEDDEDRADSSPRP